MNTDVLFKGYSKDNVQINGQEASNLILKKLNEDKPLMISRLGATELSCILNYYFINKNFLGNIMNVVKGFPYFLKFNSSVVSKMTVWSGFFPSTEDNLIKFSKMSLNDVGQIDVLASWMKHEQFIYSYFNKQHTRIFLDDLDPFLHQTPWSYGLKGKKVLVIHPFAKSIGNQYKKREFLFDDERVLPDFQLITLKAVQTLGGQGDTGFDSWFEALDSMILKIKKIDFDVALIGAGAYGMPLAAEIKRMDKKAIHVGGSLQCLFGIKGVRWEAPIYNYNNKFYNEYWVRPLDEEKPGTASSVEDACYW
jgi:hypothetical protein